MTWLSFSVSCGDAADPADIDNVLLEVVAPLLEGWRDDGPVVKSFFVRGDAPSCHLLWCLEVSAAADIQAVEAELRRVADGFDSPLAIDRVAYAPASEEWGGPQAVAMAEDHFDHSTRIALRWIAGTLGEGRSRRLSKVLLTSVLWIYGGLRDRQRGARFFAEFVERHRDCLGEPPEEDCTFPERLAEAGLRMDRPTYVALHRALHGLLEAVDAENSLPVPMLDQWFVGVTAHLEGLSRLRREGALQVGDAVPEDRALEPVLTTFLQLHHNRMGLSLPEEVHLAYVAARALGWQEAPQ